MKYLIVAQPKSASTSLLKTLGELIGESYGQQVLCKGPSKKTSLHSQLGTKALNATNKLLAVAGFKLSPIKKNQPALQRLRDDNPAIDYPLLSTIHVDICDFKDGKFLFDPDFALHKQHFPPTYGNRVACRNIPKVILIRNADDALDAYVRMTSLPGYFRFLIKNNPDFRDALRREIIDWQEGWENEVEENGGLLLTFEDVTKRTHQSLRLALEEYGLPISEAKVEGVELAKERYTGRK